MELQANNNSCCIIGMDYDVFSQIVAIFLERRLLRDSQHNVVEE
jgi:hypothetical protein